jgi:hypothetical protein
MKQTTSKEVQLSSSTIETEEKKKKKEEPNQTTFARYVAHTTY